MAASELKRFEVSLEYPVAPAPAGGVPEAAEDLASAEPYRFGVSLATLQRDARAAGSAAAREHIAAGRVQPEEPTKQTP